MHLLGQVHRLEPGRKRPHQVARLGGRSATHPGRQFTGRRGIALAAIDGGDAVLLDRGQQGGPTLLAQHAADEIPERMHVLAQGLVLGRKMDLLPFQMDSPLYPASSTPSACSSASG